MKCYIVTLKYEGHQKRYTFAGKNSKKCEAAFKEALAGLNAIGDNASSWQEFRKKAIKHMNNFGFLSIKR